MMFRTVAALLCLCSLLAAQEVRPGEENSGIERKMRASRERAAKSAGLSEAEIEGLSPEEIDKLVARDAHREPVLTSSPMCRFVAAIKPNKLMPGQSGTMRVTAILNGSAVLPSPAPIERLGMEMQGLVHIGGMTFRPAEAGKGLAPAFVGRPVYDNTAVFEIPVTMAGSAEVGKKQAVQIDLKFELFDGTTGQAIGKFLDRAVAEVEVGQAADPAVRTPSGQATTNQPVEPPAVATPAVAAPAESAAAKPAAKIVEARPPQAVAEAPPRAAPAEHAPSPEPALDGGDAAPILPIAIGGGLLLLVVVMLVARKK